MTLPTFLQTLGNLSEEEISFASDLFVPEKIKKGEYFLREGQLPNKISFIEKGLFRLFYKLEHEEKIMLIFSEAQFMTDYFGFLTNSPTIRPIQALEDSSIHSIDRNNLDKLYNHSRNWERLGRKLAESAYVTSVLRANRLLHDDYDTRVHTFLTERPSLLNRLPQYMIASYLNMTPETFSRVKRRMMKEKDIKKTIHQSSQTLASNGFLI